MWEIDLHYSWQSTLHFVQSFPEFKTVPQRHIPASFMICVPQVLLQDNGYQTIQIRNKR